MWALVLSGPISVVESNSTRHPIQIILYNSRQKLVQPSVVPFFSQLSKRKILLLSGRINNHQGKPAPKKNIIPKQPGNPPGALNAYPAKSAFLPAFSLIKLQVNFINLELLNKFMKRQNKKPAVIMPMYIETNGKVAKLMRIMRDPGTQKEYKQLLQKLESNPENIAKKLRETTWAGKTARDILEELD